MFRRKALADCGLSVIIAAALSAGSASAVTFIDQSDPKEPMALEQERLAPGGDGYILLDDLTLPELQTSDGVFSTDDAVSAEERQLFALTTQYREGKRAQAVAGLDAFLARFPESLEGWLTAAGWQATEGDAHAAHAAVARAKALAPDDNRVFAVAGVVGLNTGDLPAAVAAFDRALEINPRNFVALSVSPDVLLQSGDIPAALERFDAFGDVYGPAGAALSVYMRWAQLLIDTGNTTKAATILARSADAARADAGLATQWQTMAAAVAVAEGRTELAEQILDEMRAGRPAHGLEAFRIAATDWDLTGSPEAASRLEAFFADPAVAFAARLKAGEAYRALGRSFKAIEVYKGGMDGATPEQQFRLGDALALTYLSMNAPDEAGALLKSLAEAHMHMPAGFLIWADFLTQQRDHMGAIAALDAGLAHHPDTAELHYLKGINAFYMGNPEMSSVSLRAAVDADPSMARAWISLAKIAHDAVGHGGGGRHEPVLAIYREALERSPNNPLIHIEMGTIAIEEGQPLDAIPHFRTAIAHGRGDPLAKAMLAVVLAEHAGEMDEARTLVAEALDRLPNHVQTLFAMGRVMLMDGHAFKAAEFLDAANAARPAHGHSLAYAAVAHHRVSDTGAAVDRAERALHLPLRPEEMAMAREVLSELQGDLTLEAMVHRISPDGIHEPLGTITFADTAEGLEVVSTLEGLPEGMNGFHIHENPSCDPGYVNGALVAGQAAGAHFGAAPGMDHGHHAMHEAAPQDQRMAMADMQDGAPATMTDSAPEAMPMQGHAGMDMSGDASAPMAMDHSRMETDRSAMPKDAVASDASTAMSTMNHAGMSMEVAGEASATMEPMAGHAMDTDGQATAKADGGHGGHGAHGGHGGALPIGDLPHLMVSDAGTPMGKVMAPRLRASFIQNRSVMIHDGLSGPRIACAVIR
ncbi:MAG: tetratricopeptide repeat protein [Pseudomonadota bacterium]